MTRTFLDLLLLVEMIEYKQFNFLLKSRSDVVSYLGNESQAKSENMLQEVRKWNMAPIRDLFIHIVAVFTASHMQSRNTSSPSSRFAFTIIPFTIFFGAVGKIWKNMHTFSTSWAPLDHMLNEKVFIQTEDARHTLHVQ